MIGPGLRYCRPPPADAPWLVVCLCADWCGTCRDYRPQLEAVISDFPAYAYAWIDIEDDEIAGDIDIETFPTLLVLSAREVLFYGPVLPGEEALRRLLRALEDNGAQPTALDEAVEELVERLQSD